jgi:hypothetical protein
MPLKCRPNVDAARSQTERMINEAEKAIGEMPRTKKLGPRSRDVRTRSAEHCAPRIASARAAFSAASENPDPLAQRDGYIRAAFQAGQALTCARVHKINKKMGTMPVPKPKKKKDK